MVHLKGNDQENDTSYNADQIISSRAQILNFDLIVKISIPFFKVFLLNDLW